MTRPKTVLVLLLSALLPTAPACSGPAAPAYSRQAVQPVQLVQRGDGRWSLSYQIPPETMFHSPGVDYAQRGQTLEVVIVRCGLRQTCRPMASNLRPPGKDWRAEVLLPNNGGEVVLVHADGRQTLSP